MEIQAAAIPVQNLNSKHPGEMLTKINRLHSDTPQMFVSALFPFYNVSFLMRLLFVCFPNHPSLTGKGEKSIFPRKSTLRIPKQA